MAKILIVDDEAYIRMLYKKELESEGYQIKTAATAAGAFDLLRAEQFDIIVLDIELGDDNGLELLNEIRQNYRDCGIILNSAYSTYKADFQTWLADAYIMKSSNLDPLKNKIKDLSKKDHCES